MFKIVRSTPGFLDFWQLHYSENVSKDQNSPEPFIANLESNIDSAIRRPIFQAQRTERRQLHDDESANGFEQGISGSEESR